MNDLRESFNNNLSSVRWKLRDVKEISQKIHTLVGDSALNDDTIKLKVQFNAEDGSSIEGDHIGIFSNDTLKTKRYRSVKINCSKLSSGEVIRDLQLSLSHGNSSDKNYLRGESTDGAWLWQAANQIQSLISSLEPRSEIIKYGYMISYIFTAGIGWSVFRLAKIYFDLDLTLLIIAACVPVSFLIQFLLERIHPKTELQIGPEHLFTEKSRRNSMWQMVSLLILPLALQFLPTLITPPETTNKSQSSTIKPEPPPQLPFP